MVTTLWLRIQAYISRLKSFDMSFLKKIVYIKPCDVKSGALSLYLSSFLDLLAGSLIGVTVLDSIPSLFQQELGYH